MHIDDFMKLFNMEYIKQLYLEDNNVNLFEKLEIINEITKLILSEHDDKEILNYITKNDLAIIKEYGFI